MEVDEIGAVLEKIWDLHDKLSDAIHSVFRAHFLNSVKNRKSGDYFPSKKKSGEYDTENNIGPGFVFVKEFRCHEDEPAVQEAKSLCTIRTALENLEDQLEFLHTLEMLQRAEREAAVARLEQSRIILAMQLARHQGKNYNVIEEVLAFIGNVRGASPLVTPENLYGPSPYPLGQNLGPKKGNSLNALFDFFISGFSFVSKTLKPELAVMLMGNATLFAISMVAFMHLNRFSCKAKHTLEGFGRESKKASVDHLECLDIMLARG